MIKWLNSLTGRDAPPADQHLSELDLKVIPRSVHGISRKQIDQNALKVLYRLQKAGYQSCLVGGAVRDLLLGGVPKDFDVATDATPEEIRKLFRNCRLIGRRFRLAHIHFGRQVIEVATFRGEHGRSESGHRDESGRILRDNVYGDITEDVWRRDFTANALYYNIADFTVLDYVGGYEDIKQKRLRLIGDPGERYREDPVRMLRAIRFSEKLGFSIDDSCEKFIYEWGGLLRDIPPARLYEEALKLFHSGHAAQAYRALRQYNLLQHLFPDARGGPIQDDVADRFVSLCMRSTDERIEQEQPVTPAFLFAALLWHAVQKQTEQNISDGMPFAQALQQSATSILSRQVRYVSIPRRFTMVMRDIWFLQSRFRYQSGRRAFSLLSHPKFRAAYDFLCLRARAGEAEAVEQECNWWTELQHKQPQEQKQILAPAGQKHRGGRFRRAGKKPDRAG